jgi:hypothetical protein
LSIYNYVEMSSLLFDRDEAPPLAILSETCIRRTQQFVDVVRFLNEDREFASSHRCRCQVDVLNCVTTSQSAHWSADGRQNGMSITIVAK